MHCRYNPDNDEFKEWMKAAERETWRYIPQIKSRVAVEMMLDKCVQQLRKKVIQESLQKKQAQNMAEMSNRVPSFFTSGSLVNMSGLCITDRHSIDNSFSGETKSQRPSPISNEIPADISTEVPSGWNGMGLRGNFSSGSLNRSGSGLFLIDGESEDEKSASDVISPNPGEGNKGSQSAGELQGYIKTSSMANFYYQRKSQGSFTKLN